MAQTSIPQSILQKAKGFFTIRFKKISVDQVKERYKVLYEGWLRKKGLKWRWYYMIVTDHNIFYYSDECANSFAGKISLYGYNQVRRAPEEPGKGNCFAMVHASRDPAFKTYYFSASGSEEQLRWMVQLRNALKIANEQVVASINNVDEESFDELEQPIYELEDMPHNNNTEHDTIDSDPEDYEKIDEDELDSLLLSKSGGGYPGTGTLVSNASSDMGYSDFDSPNSKLAKQPPPSHSIHRPRLPSPIENESVIHSPELPRPRCKPLPELPSDDPPNTPETSTKMPQGSHVSALAAVLMEKSALNSKPKISPKPKVALPNEGSSPYSPNISSTYQGPKTLPLPPTPNQTLATDQTSPTTYFLAASSESQARRKPTLPVKPTVRREKIFWNGDKSEATRLLSASSQGVFLVRGSTADPSQMVLAVSSGGGTVHAVKIYTYDNGYLGVKRGVVTSPDDMHATIYDLIKHFRNTTLYLREASLQLTLTNAHELAEAELIHSQSP